MGNNLADFIERCILGKFVEAENEYILMRRNDLAIELSCAPSQISYVLNTRFTPERGFVVKSRRGAGGFVRIVRLVPAEQVSGQKEEDAGEVLDRLLAAKAVSHREHVLLRYLLEAGSINLDRQELRALLREALKRMGEIS
jgi:transcriptional regulator CtsR